MSLFANHKEGFFGCKSLHQTYEGWLCFSATFVSNDKVNERIFQRQAALPDYFFFLFFQRPDKLEQFGKRPQASRMIVSHANNHLLTLGEFASDKANYHLKMSSKTLWAKKLASWFSVILSRIRNHSHMHGCLCAAGTSCDGGSFVSLPCPLSKLKKINTDALQTPPATASCVCVGPELRVPQRPRSHWRVSPAGVGLNPDRLDTFRPIFKIPPNR